ncbi:hypothetical protein STCU_08547 [Strigomonas culicis]|uniref:Uncharacterized protein n=1 Tax=Strigomonas culicis TaxID=28005 RepID=S9TSQ7_9TRYP|nr:hypothetical protein STCU_08547 [Strigomonas culicis]|eukprot:EPY21437.1 hypothetical protein STCU_08547 [Strigomonas culicis]
MPEVKFNREFLHRCCVHFSSSLVEEKAATAECEYALCFVRAHGHQYPTEIARALVWRVVESEDLLDRAGAWLLLTSVLLECSDIKRDLMKTTLADKISSLLHYLIGHRWFTLLVSTARTGTGQLDLTSYGNVVPAAALKGEDQIPLAVDAAQSEVLARRYRAILTTWKQIWREDVYHVLKEEARAAQRNGNHLSEKGALYLSVPDTFKDSLWCLRRKEPRPHTSWHVLRCNGWPGLPREPQSSNAVRPPTPALPASMAEVDALDRTMHPTARAWVRRLLEADGGCRLCNTWRHTEARCPCEMPFQRSPTDEGEARRRQWLTQHRAKRFTPIEAIELLFSHGLRLPLQPPQVLDTITTLIRGERPYEDVLDAYDVVRGAVTGPLERHALWLHASHALLPSKTLFAKPSDDALSPAMERARRYLQDRRRLVEYRELMRSVEVLDGPFRRRALPPAARGYLEEVRETNSFFFCLVDGSLPADFTPGRYARVPEEVVALAPIKDILCRACLEPFHAAERCPARRGDGPVELWDLQVARLVLEDNALLDLSYPREAGRVEEALRRIDADDRHAKEFRKLELSLAVKLIHERRGHICRPCNMAGHRAATCEVHARAVLARERLREVDVRLDPHDAIQRLHAYQRDGNQEALRDLRDAVNVFAGHGRRYPAAYLTAIQEFDDARIPLAAVRYCTAAVRSFLMAIRSSDLLQQLPPLTEPDFPEVCLFCDSYHHRGEDCDRPGEEERGFLRHLRGYGVTLWVYLQRPPHYDRLLPPEHAAGREAVLLSVRQFEKDYGVGGIARKKFLELNGLSQVEAQPAEAIASQLGSASFSQVAPLPGGGSRSVPAAAHQSQETETALDGESPVKRHRAEGDERAAAVEENAGTLV